LPVWEQVIKPWLLSKTEYVRVDPKEVIGLGSEAREEYLWRSLLRDVYLGVIKDIIELIEGSEKIVLDLRKKAKGEIEEKDFQIGR